MGKCMMCDRETDEMVDDVDGKSYLCRICQNRFDRCEICGSYCPGENLAENGICDDCKEELESIYS